MGTYINKGNEGFRSAVNGEYVDKTGLIEVISKTLNTERRYTCLTRCRRFGKTMAVDMLRAYYDKSCDSRQLIIMLRMTISFIASWLQARALLILYSFLVAMSRLLHL